MDMVCSRTCIDMADVACENDYVIGHGTAQESRAYGTGGCSITDSPWDFREETMKYLSGGETAQVQGKQNVHRGITQR